MANEHILIVEDEEDLVELLRFNLVKNGYTVSAALRGDEGLKMARALVPDLILLDVMLPGLDGIEVARALRKDDRTAGIPIVMLTARAEESDMITGLELGADDYVTKPFSPKVLIARLRAVLRRRRHEPVKTEESVRIRDLVINPGRHEVLAGGKPLDLTFSEMRILHLLASRPGWVFSRDQIVNAVHGEAYPVTDRAVDVQIVGLRKKLGARARYVETVRGVGYRFQE
jgi:two-component system alkaline phosphatase synthesis response regulator PhoP